MTLHAKVSRGTRRRFHAAALALLSLPFWGRGQELPDPLADDLVRAVVQEVARHTLARVLAGALCEANPWLERAGVEEWALELMPATQLPGAG